MGVVLISAPGCHWHQELVELSALAPGDVVNPDMAVHISAVGLSFAQHGPSRSADVDALARPTGRTPLAFRQYVRADPDALFPTDRPSGTTLPGRRTIVGAGYQGIEFASIDRRFGSQVTVFEAAPIILGREEGRAA
ncbi:NAD-binding protein [Nonomuraea sp. 10N515B]|uniref:NAD-binding protein n=1 Tax=Nonomuraea sp. 10N515B TaxID=3457422 RepID=UPI003FCE8EC9